MKEEILKLRQEGKTYNEIVKILGCSKSTVSYHCKHINNNNDIKNINIEIKNISQKKDKFLLPNEETIKKIIFLRNNGKKYNEISEELNISINKISKICRKLNITKLYKPNKTKLSLNKIKEISELYNKLKSSRKVAEELNISKSTVLKYINPNKKKREKTITKSQAVINWRKRVKIKLVEYKGGKCEKCGYEKYVEVLEFHHKNPNEKDFTISGKSWSYERLKNEVDKCIMVCSNCHKEIHLETQKNGL